MKARLLLGLILLLGLSLRLYHVTSPYLDHHSWRQTDTAAIARNFSKHGFNILKPEVDWAGDGPSVAELEFQITPLLTAGLYAIWGVQDWVGRVVPILFWLVAAVYFFLLVRSTASGEMALFSSFVFAVLPLSVFFTRVPMPESGATFFAIASMYHLAVYRRGARPQHYWLAMLFASLALLSKLTNLFLVAPLLFILLERRESRPVAFERIVAFFAIPLALTAAYYAYMHSTADIRLIPYTLGSDKWGNLGTWLNPVFYKVLWSRLLTVIFTAPGLLLLLIGLFLPVASRRFHIWLLAALGYVFVVATGNLVHTYYQMPLIPAGAFFIGLALHRLYASERIRVAALVACAVLLYSAVANLLPMYGMYAIPAYEAARRLNEVDRSRSLVLFVPHRPDINPEMLYYADRKGWIISPQQVSVATIEEFKRRGAMYLVLPVSGRLSSDLKTYFSEKLVWSAGTYLLFRL